MFSAICHHISGNPRTYFPKNEYPFHTKSKRLYRHVSSLSSSRFLRYLTITDIGTAVNMAMYIFRNSSAVRHPAAVCAETCIPSLLVLPYLVPSFFIWSDTFLLSLLKSFSYVENLPTLKVLAVSFGSGLFSFISSTFPPQTKIKLSLKLYHFFHLLSRFHLHPIQHRAFSVVILLVFHSNPCPDLYPLLCFKSFRIFPFTHKT